MRATPKPGLITSQYIPATHTPTMACACILPMTSYFPRTATSRSSLTGPYRPPFYAHVNMESSGSRPSRCRSSSSIWSSRIHGQRSFQSNSQSEHLNQFALNVQHPSLQLSLTTPSGSSSPALQSTTCLASGSTTIGQYVRATAQVLVIKIAQLERTRIENEHPCCCQHTTLVISLRRMILDLLGSLSHGWCLPSQWWLELLGTSGHLTERSISRPFVLLEHVCGRFWSFLTPKIFLEAWRIQGLVVVPFDTGQYPTYASGLYMSERR